MSKTISFRENKDGSITFLGGRKEELPRFLVIFNKEMNYYTKSQLSTFLKTAVLHNEDVTSFQVIDTEKPMTYRQGLTMARQFGLTIEFSDAFHQAITGGMKENDAVKYALTEWDII